MKKYILVLSLLFILCSELFAHQQGLHQYITREAFKLLKKSFPTQLNEMEGYLGNSEVWSGGSADGSFGALKIVSGAWLEDETDVVYGYGLTRTPNYNQSLPTDFIHNIFGTYKLAHTTITHFWNADNGENAPTDLSDKAAGIYWSFTIPENAMQKIRKYSNGLYDFIWYYNNERMSWTWCDANSLQLMTKFDVPSVVNFYKSTESFQANSYIAEDGNWYRTTCPTWDQSYTTFQKAHAYEILGRMCHLLE